MRLLSISFNQLRALFNDDWDIGYLSPENLYRCGMHPVKKVSLPFLENYSNDLYFNNLSNTIVLIRKAHTWDYTLYEEACRLLWNAGIRNCKMIDTNFKEAAILSGLGVRAKNSLIYSYKFGFDHHICAFRFDEEIIDVPTDKRINYNIWNRCLGCDDCAKACPVGAIHNEGKEFSWWINSSACYDFIAYGNDPNIPSVKQFWYKHVHPEIPQDQIEKITGHFQGLDLNWDANGYNYDGQIVRKDGEPVDVPVCRECTSQKRCSPWNGEYPYFNLKDLL